MSLIAGYFGQDNRVSEDSLRQKLYSYACTSSANPDDYENSLVSTSYGHIIQKYKKDYPIRQEPLKDQHKNHLWIHGFVLKPSRVAIAQHLAKYIVDSNDDLNELEGEFVAILTAGIGEQIHIVNDRFASIPFYVLRTHDSVYFSSDFLFLKYLYDLHNEVDVLGLLQLSVLGHTIDTRTTRKGINRLRPGTHLIISREGVSERQYWKLKHTPEDDLNPEEFSERVFESLRGSMAARAKLTDKGLITITGGSDSRLLAGTLPQDTDFEALTWVTWPTAVKMREVGTAIKLVHTLGLNHHIEVLSKYKLLDMANDLVRLTGGLQKIDGPIGFMRAIDTMKRENMKFLFAGGPGDSISGGYTTAYELNSVNTLDPHRMEECIAFYSHNTVSLSFDTLSLLFKKHVLAEYYPLIEGSIKESFNNINGPTFVHKVTAWGIHNQAGVHFTNPTRNHPDIVDVLPHLGYKFIDLMLKLPAHWLYRRNFYCFMIQHCIPRLREIEYVNSSAKRPSWTSNQVLYYGNFKKIQMIPFLRLNAKKLVKHLAGENTIERIRKRRRGGAESSVPSFWYEVFQEDGRWLREIEEILHSYQSLRTILDIEKCSLFLNSFKSRLAVTSDWSTDAKLLSILATLSLTFRNFDE